MTTTTTPADFITKATSAEGAPAKPGFLTRLRDRIIAARMARAERQLEPFLATLSDERLKDLGFTSERIENLRERHYADAVYWS